MLHFAMVMLAVTPGETNTLGSEHSVPISIRRNGKRLYQVADARVQGN